MIAHDPEILMTGEVIASDTISIDPRAGDRARQLAHYCQHPNRQWSVYLQALTAAAFQQWLADWLPEQQADIQLPGFQRSSLPLDTAIAAEVLGSASYAAVGDFRLSLLRLDSNDASVSLPRAVIALPDYCAHFYVAIEVREELHQAHLCGFLRYDQLQARLQSSALMTSTDWHYSLPLTWFEPGLDELALYLRDLEPAAIALPAPMIASPLQAGLRAELAPLRQQLHAERRELWEVLNWSQLNALLHAPAVLTWFLTPPGPAERVINVAAWLSDRLDTLATELQWTLLPAFAPYSREPQGATGLRSPGQELDDLMVQLERRGADIAAEARGGYQDFRLVSTWLRLYAVTWAQTSPDQSSEWKLLIVLGTPDGRSLPNGSRLRVSDNQELLVEHTMQQEFDAPYLYARVAGTWDETFTVEVTHPAGATHAFPVFAFQPR
ncbi:MAG: DUF1822 family protein [Spirulinaceae cyanobacterium SM2_1_0]|nr:DUF1822 family protein [Spirulinaceae cyanobacterium SM2_1_0]